MDRGDVPELPTSRRIVPAASHTSDSVSAIPAARYSVARILPSSTVRGPHRTTDLLSFCYFDSQRCPHLLHCPFQSPLDSAFCCPEVCDQVFFLLFGCDRPAFKPMKSGGFAVDG